MRYCLRVPLLLGGLGIQTASIVLIAVGTRNATAYYPLVMLYVHGILATVLFVLLVPVRCLLAGRLELVGSNRAACAAAVFAGRHPGMVHRGGPAAGGVSLAPPSTQETLHIPRALVADGLLAFAFSIPVIAIVLAERKSTLGNAAVVFWVAFVAVLHLGWIRLTRDGNGTLWEFGVLPDALFIATLAANALVFAPGLVFGTTGDCVFLECSRNEEAGKNEGQSSLVAAGFTSLTPETGCSPFPASNPSSTRSLV